MSIQITATGASIGTVNLTVTGGIGPPGPQGPQGPSGPPTNVTELDDVLVESVADGDLLRYSSGKFRNYSERSVTDGGNF